MKENLTTFPVKSTPQRYEDWKKRFQKELRKMKSINPNAKSIRNKIIEEILGE